MMSTIIEPAISKVETVLMPMRVNMAIGEDNGNQEATIMSGESTSPLLMPKTTIMNAATNMKVKGVSAVLRSSILETVEPIAP